MTGLSPREEEVLRLVARGMTSAAIGHELGIGAATVDDHVKRARAKLGASSRLEAARLVAGS
jgi:DNA-binding CsgD family transcriptional regulator